ncbi:DUF6602 domain-containing protein [Terrabacter sp. GCM10028922]|uniref:DUF6602 domain-containing protein n=1 Tax=Terrabacter sp. GCM10028922 TaxID=3273428 RepID=UPI003607236F
MVEDAQEEQEGWDPPLGDPNSEGWFPRPLTKDSLKQAFFQRCLGVERILMLRADLERRMNIDNFDSGPGFEDILRDEVARLLPDRYSVRAGVVSDSVGFSAGDCDVVIYNATWFPAIKAGATGESRRWHYPIDGVYGVLEAKQSLSAGSLEAAMQKLVSVSRLHVDPSPSLNRVVENRGDAFASADDPSRVFTAIVAGGLAKDEDLEDLVHRFVAINGQLPRAHLVNALVVLGVGYVSFATTNPKTGHPMTARHTAFDDELPLYPTLFREREGEQFSAFYLFVSGLLSHLTGTVLFAHGVARKYGAELRHEAPVTDHWNMLPCSEASPDLQDAAAYKAAADAYEQAQRRRAQGEGEG